MEDKWVCAITNCLLGTVGLCGKTWASKNGCCWQLELTAQIGITGHDSNAEQSCGEEGWLYVIPVEQLAVKEIVPVFPTEN